MPAVRHLQVVLPNYKLTIDESVAVLMGALKKAGCLTGGETPSSRVAIV